VHTDAVLIFTKAEAVLILQHFGHL
jgi:hypothetical protein